MLLGSYLTLLIGPTVAVPAPPSLLESLLRIEVEHREKNPEDDNDFGQSGFQIVFGVGRAGPADLLDFALASNPLLKVFNRVIMVVTMNAIPTVLMDGIITHIELNPSADPGQSTLTVMGKDVSVMMDLEDHPVEHPAQPEMVIALKLIATYAQYGLIPMVLPPPSVDIPLPIQRIPVQQESDLEFLHTMADALRVCVLRQARPCAVHQHRVLGAAPTRGDPAARRCRSRSAARRMSTASAFATMRWASRWSRASVQDSLTNQKMPVKTFASLRPPLSVFPALLVNQPNVPLRQYRATGLNLAQAFSRAQGETDRYSEAVVADGELDTMRYGGILNTRGLVGVRGAGYSYDGLWYVKRVKHRIERENYLQDFTLTREGLGSTVPVVIP